MRRNRPFRAAFTLLEVILALGLSALLIGVLAMAIQTSMKATHSGRTDVAQAQLARAALEKIGADLRSAVWYEPVDPYSMVAPPAVSSLASTSSGGSGGSGSVGGSGGSGGSSSSVGSGGTSGSAGTAGTAGTSGSGGTSGSAGGSGGGPSSGGSGSRSSGSSGGGGVGSSGGGMGSSGGGGSSSGSSGSSTTTTTPLPLPMFVGGQNWLQVDISHLPRPDQYAFMQYSSSNMSGGNLSASSTSGSNSSANSMAMRDRISEIKTVFYFLAGGAGQALPPGLSSSMAGGNQQGLMRREADRVVTAWASYGGGSSGLGPAVEALAPEIATLKFQYFNGSAWTTTWDSRVNYALPRAVEITITLVDEPAERASTKRPAGKTSPKEYVLRVPIPAWRPPNLQVLNSMAIQAEQNAASGSSSSSSTSTGTAGMGSY